MVEWLHKRHLYTDFVEHWLQHIFINLKKGLIMPWHNDMYKKNKRVFWEDFKIFFNAATQTELVFILL